jgi:hypothetical protein
MSEKEQPKLSTAQKRALLDRNISSRTVSRKAEQAINDEKEHKVRKSEESSEQTQTNFKKKKKREKKKKKEEKKKSTSPLERRAPMSE